MSDLLHRLGLAVVSMECKAGGWPWLSHGPEVVCSLLSEAIAEIERLRLTDEEQSLIRRLAAECDHPRAWTNRALTADDRATLRGLLERTK